MRLLDIRTTKRPRCNNSNNKIVSLAAIAWLLLALGGCHSAHARPAHNNNRTSKSGSSRDPDDYYNILGLRRSAKPKDIKVRRMSTTQQ